MEINENYTNYTNMMSTGLKWKDKLIGISRFSLLTHARQYFMFLLSKYKELKLKETMITIINKVPI